MGGSGPIPIPRCLDLEPKKRELWGLELRLGVLCLVSERVGGSRFGTKTREL